MYTKGDMLYSDYQWDYEAYILRPRPIFDDSYTETDRDNGYKMLHLINGVAALLDYSESDLLSYHELEAIIRTHLPTAPNTYAKIADWVLKNAPM